MDLFPACLSIEEKTKHWISIFSHFKPPHLRAMKTILSQKRRYLIQSILFFCLNFSTIGFKVHLFLCVQVKGWVETLFGPMQKTRGITLNSTIVIFLTFSEYAFFWSKNMLIS